MSQGPEVLVVDDEIDLAEVVAGYLQAEGSRLPWHWAGCGGSGQDWTAATGRA